jgi:UrcA family protein
MKFNTIVLAIAAFGAALPIAAQAQDQTETANSYKVSQAVQFSDLDLTATQGRVRLDQRLSSAVRRVCGSTGSRDLAQLARIRDCRRAAAQTASRGREFAMASSTRRGSVAMVTGNTPVGAK